MKYNLVLFSFLVLVFLGCDTDRDLSENDIKEIQNLEIDFVKGWFKENQQEAVLSAFEKNAVFIPHHGGSSVIGTKNLKEFFWPEGIGGIVHKFNHFPDTIEGNKDVAWIRGRHCVKYSWIIKNDTITTSNEGNYVLIARKQKNLKWKIATFIFNDPVAEVSD